MALLVSDGEGIGTQTIQVSDKLVNPMVHTTTGCESEAGLPSSAQSAKPCIQSLGIQTLPSLINWWNQRGAQKLTCLYHWSWSSRTRVPSLQNLMPDALRWSWCNNNNRDKVCNNLMCLNHLESPIPPPWSIEKLFYTKPVPGAKKDGDHCSRMSSISTASNTILLIF